MGRILRLLRLVLEPVPGAKGWLDTLQPFLTLVWVGIVYVIPAVAVGSPLVGAVAGSSALALLLAIALYRKDLEVETHLDEVKRIAQRLRRRTFQIRSRDVSVADLFVCAGRTLLRGLSSGEFQVAVFRETSGLRKGRGHRFSRGDIPAEEILTELEMAEVVSSEYFEPMAPNRLGAFALGQMPYYRYNLLPLGKRVLTYLEESSNPVTTD